MTTSPRNIVPTPSVKALAELRTLAASPSGSMADALSVTKRQARLLRNLLPEGAAIADAVTDLIPRVRIDFVDDIPLAGISFWGRRQWNIHVRASDPVEGQQFTILHELKHIIDHPLRREHPDLFSDADWEALANHFAMHVSVRQSVAVAVQGKGEHT